MTQSSETTIATVAGAAIGALIGYLFFTEQGRAVRRRLDPALDDLNRELNGLRTTVRKASIAVAEGWSIVNEALGDNSAPPRIPPRQASPF
ncbi:MAG: YtxH domain-containing protein [Acidobacteria bacterium]|nr:YtxH domain-containing protein [Acidobacteriota bacterium]